MNICLLSYEFPPYPAGGIGSYVYRASRGLAQAGHRVTVIAGGHTNTVRESQGGIRVVRLRWEPPGRFLWQVRPLLHNLQKVAMTYRSLHQDEPFQIIEAPEYQAEAYYLVSGKLAPIVTKLHTSGLFLWNLEARALGKNSFKRALARTMIRLTLGRLEKRVIRGADRIHAPSQAISQVTQKMCGIKPEQIDLVPYPFYPSGPVQGSAREDNTILYVGRLEVCKGVHLFSCIIPDVLRDFPGARFIFLGRDFWYKGNVSMSQWLRKQLGAMSQNCEFWGEAPYSQVYQSMRRAAVCIFPSLWENFPNVCLEAMDAGACVVGSTSGGMAEMLVDGESGLLADPARPDTFAEKVKIALAAPGLRQRLGEAARMRLYDLYRPEIIIPQQLAAYHKAIDQYHHA